MRIWIDFGEIYGTKFGLLIYHPKMLILRLIITNFGTLRMHQIAPILSKIFRTPLAKVIISNHNRANNASGM